MLIQRPSLISVGGGILFIHVMSLRFAPEVIWRRRRNWGLFLECTSILYGYRTAMGLVAASVRPRAFGICGALEEVDRGGEMASRPTGRLSPKESDVIQRLVWLCLGVSIELSIISDAYCHARCGAVRCHLQLNSWSVHHVWNQQFPTVSVSVFQAFLLSNSPQDGVRWTMTIIWAHSALHFVL
jgi:hypothetical protein